VSKTPKPIIHSRDHEHGGADTVRIHYESVGGSGGGGAASQAVYGLTASACAVGVLKYFTWSYTGGDGPLLDLTDPLVPVTVDAGVYAYLFGASIGSTVFEIANGGWAYFTFQAAGSSGFQNGFESRPVQQLHGSDIVRTFGSFTVGQDAGGTVYATVTNETAATADASGGCFVQRIS
jgi:hypothetical protein